MKFSNKTIREIADMICGNDPKGKFVYRSSRKLTEFFQYCDTDYKHDGSTRDYWVYQRLQEILSKTWPNAITPPETFSLVIKFLMDKSDAISGDNERTEALTHLNTSLAREEYEAFYTSNKQCCLRYIGGNNVAATFPSSHRPFSQLEIMRREQLLSYLNKSSEDELIEEILLPLFRQLGFHRITAAGHKDKALEYGKDIWMKYTLPTQHVLYFGIQAKKGKLDASGNVKAKNTNIAEIYNQVLMMIGHEIFDSEISKKVLVDHAFIVAGGEITKQARNWLAEKLDNTKRSQVMFMDRDDILNSFAVTNLPLPNNTTSNGEMPFQKYADKNENNKEQGYKYSRLWLNDYLKKQDRWNIEKYRERFEIIYERFLKIWPLAIGDNGLFLNSHKNSELNIFDAEDPKNKKLEYFIFEDKKIDENDFTKMYIYVLKELYRKNPELFLNNKKIKISNREGDFRSPKKVENGYYVETNSDSNTKFSSLKEMLEIFSLEDCLIIKYKD